MADNDFWCSVPARDQETEEFLEKFPTASSCTPLHDFLATFPRRPTSYYCPCRSPCMFVQSLSLQALTVIEAGLIDILYQGQCPTLVQLIHMRDPEVVKELELHLRMPVTGKINDLCLNYPTHHFTLNYHLYHTPAKAYEMAIMSGNLEHVKIISNDLAPEDRKPRQTIILIANTLGYTDVVDHFVNLYPDLYGEPRDICDHLSIVNFPKVDLLLNELKARADAEGLPLIDLLHQELGPQRAQNISTYILMANWKLTLFRHHMFKYDVDSMTRMFEDDSFYRDFIKHRNDLGLLPWTSGRNSEIMRAKILISPHTYSIVEANSVVTYMSLSYIKEYEVEYIARRGDFPWDCLSDIMSSQHLDVLKYAREKGVRISSDYVRHAILSYSISKVEWMLTHIPYKPWFLECARERGLVKLVARFESLSHAT